MKVIFKNLSPSKNAKATVQERLTPVLTKFPDQSPSGVTVTLEMENSPQQAGPDLYSVGVLITKGPFRGIKIRKKAMDLMIALADVKESLFSHLSRLSEKKLTKRKKKFPINEYLLS